MTKDPSAMSVLITILLMFFSAVVSRYFALKDTVSQKDRQADKELFTVKLKALEDKLDILINNTRARLAKHEKDTG